MGAQKDIAKEIIKNEADYVLALKGNQETLYNDVELFFKEEILTRDKKELENEGKYFKTLDNSHGRLEKREYYVHNDIEWLSQKSQWTGLSGIGLCIAERTVGDKKSIEYSYAIYSCKDLRAEEFGKFKRGHWGIENSLHWVLDIAFREDESRARKDNSAENLNILRHVLYTG